MLVSRRAGSYRRRRPAYRRWAGVAKRDATDRQEASCLGDGSTSCRLVSSSPCTSQPLRSARSSPGRPTSGSSRSGLAFALFALAEVPLHHVPPRLDRVPLRAHDRGGARFVRVHPRASGPPWRGSSSRAGLPSRRRGVSVSRLLPSSPPLSPAWRRAAAGGSARFGAVATTEVSLRRATGSSRPLSRWNRARRSRGERRQLHAHDPLRRRARRRSSSPATPSSASSRRPGRSTTSARSPRATWRARYAFSSRTCSRRAKRATWRTRPRRCLRGRRSSRAPCSGTRA